MDKKYMKSNRIVTPSSKHNKASSILGSKRKRSLQELKIAYESLKKKKQSLVKEIAELKANGETGDITLEKQALHNYMDIKDAAQKVIGCLVNLEEGCSIVELYKRYNAPLDDN